MNTIHPNSKLFVPTTKMVISFQWNESAPSIEVKLLHIGKINAVPFAQGSKKLTKS